MQAPAWMRGSSQRRTSAETVEALRAVRRVAEAIVAGKAELPADAVEAAGRVLGCTALADHVPARHKTIDKSVFTFQVHY